MNWIKDFSKVIAKSSQLLTPLLTDYSVSELDKLIQDWFNKDITKIIYPELEERIRKLHKQGYEIYFVTSTIEPIAKSFQEYFGFGKIVATELKEENGHYSTYPDGKPCHGQEKSDRIMELALSDKLDLANSIAFSDHISDLYMLKIVGHPVVVNPKPLLKLIAKKNKWEIISPKLS